MLRGLGTAREAAGTTRFAELREDAAGVVGALALRAGARTGRGLDVDVEIGRGQDRRDVERSPFDASITGCFSAAAAL